MNESMEMTAIMDSNVKRESENTCFHSPLTIHDWTIHEKITT